MEVKIEKPPDDGKRDKIKAVEALIERINLMLAKHYEADGTSIFGKQMKLHQEKKWWYIRGIDTSQPSHRKGYVFIKINPETMDAYSQSGVKPICKVEEIKDTMMSPYGFFRELKPMHPDLVRNSTPRLWWD